MILCFQYFGNGEALIEQISMFLPIPADFRQKKNSGAYTSILYISRLDIRSKFAVLISMLEMKRYFLTFKVVD